jgi:hypothetical protein
MKLQNFEFKNYLNHYLKRSGKKFWLQFICNKLISTTAHESVKIISTKWFMHISHMISVSIFLENFDTFCLFTESAGGRDKGFGIYFQGKWAQVCWPKRMGGQWDPCWYYVFDSKVYSFELFPLLYFNMILYCKDSKTRFDKGHNSVWPKRMGGQWDPCWYYVFRIISSCYFSAHLGNTFKKIKRIIFNVDNQAVVAIINSHLPWK